MKNEQFIYNPKIIWIYLITSYLLLLTGFFTKLQGWEILQDALVGGRILFFLTWLIIMVDIVKTPIFNKTFWVISIFIIPPIASLFYMILRNRLIRLGS